MGTDWGSAIKDLTRKITRTYVIYIYRDGNGEREYIYIYDIYDIYIPVYI